jgi:hypothetical protein
MKITKIALAAVVALCAAQAQAATVYLAGASATSANYKAALESLCSGTKTTVQNGTDANRFYVKCSTSFTGLPGIDAVSFNVAGGSFTAVSTSLGTDTATFLETTGVVSAAKKSEGGFLDIDAGAFPSDLLSASGISVAPATPAAKFGQVFGVAVSPALYALLQANQGITVPKDANGVPTVDDRLPQYQPTITKAQYATLVEDSDNSSKADPAVILPGVDKITICRRVSSSGTQAASNQYFLNAWIGNDGEVKGARVPSTAADFGGGDPYDVVEGSGTGNVRTCLSGNLADGSGYAIGVMSLENNPDTVATSYTKVAGAFTSGKRFRYLKLNGVAGYDGVKNTDSAKTGAYDFWFNSRKYGHTANGTAVINAIDNTLATLNVTGLFGSATNPWKHAGDNNAAPVLRD